MVRLIRSIFVMRFETLDATSYRMIVRNCAFEGNEPYALSAGPDTPVDARGNWWGDARGPRVRPTSTLGTLPPFALGMGLGDNVSEQPLVVPFLTSPP
jgi:hypothetical protein